MSDRQYNSTDRASFWNLPRKAWEIPVWGIITVGLLILTYLGPGILKGMLINDSSSPQARESCLVGNLQMIRNALMDFHQDTGVYPQTLSDIYAGNVKGLITKLPHEKTFHGPYLKNDGMSIPGTKLPRNIYLPNTEDPVVEHHWRYNPHTGEVHSAVEEVTTEGRKLSEL